MPTLRRRNSDRATGGRAPLRSSLADAAWEVEDRVVWGAADLFRGLVDAIRWPFERVAWAIEHWLVWPVQEETALWSRPVRAAVLAAVLLLAGAGVAAGVLVSDPSGGGIERATRVAKVSAPAVVHTRVTPATKRAPAAQVAGAKAADSGTVLHGSTPDFVPESGGGVAKSEAGQAPAAKATTEAGGGALTGAKESDATGTRDAGSAVAGPAAIKVARRFAGAFVLYETGQVNRKVRAAFHETAAADLSAALLKRPPRLPANVKVPKAKVLNIVAGPKHGETYTLSISLLRVGATSELRVDMSKTKKNGWQVTDVRG